MRAALYARVSTKDKGQDPEVQLRELRQLAEHRGWEVVGEYVDHASGSTESRVEFDRLLADARSGKLDLIVFWRLDRFGRSRKHLIDTLEVLVSWGVGFLSLKDGDFDTTTATGRLLVRILATLAQFESELMGERIAAGMAASRARGGPPVGRPRSEVDLETAKALLDQGWPLPKVARAIRVSLSTLRRRIADECGTCGQCKSWNPKKMLGMMVLANNGSKVAMHGTCGLGIQGAEDHGRKLDTRSYGSMACAEYEKREE